MNVIVVMLSDVIDFNGESWQTLSREELEAGVRRRLAFLPKSAKVTIEGEVVTIELPETTAPNAAAASQLYERAGKRAREGQYRKAVDIYRRVLELDPSLLTARRDLAMAYVELGEVEEAKNHLIEVLRLDPKDCWSWVVLANLYSKYDNDFVTAEKFYRRALEVTPTDPWALNGLGALKMERGQPQEALQCFDEAVSAHPQFANALYGKAMVLQSLGELSRSAETLRTLFHQAEYQDARSAPVFENARHLLLEVERTLADKRFPDTFKAVESYRADVERLSGFPVRVSPEDLPDMLSGVAQIAWKHGRDHHLIKHNRAVPPLLHNTLSRMS
jgi:Tfp pilus assembly protein PilF